MLSDVIGFPSPFNNEIKTLGEMDPRSFVHIEDIVDGPVIMNTIHCVQWAVTPCAIDRNCHGMVLLNLMQQTARVAVLGTFNIYGLWYIFKNKMFVWNIGNTSGLACHHYNSIRNAIGESKLSKRQRFDIVENWANEICNSFILSYQRK